MTFPNGLKGVKKLFTSELLSLIAAVLFVIAGIAALVSVAAAATAEGEIMLTGVAGAGLFTLIAGILIIIAYILKLVGLHQAGKDEQYLNTGFMIAICALILAVISAVLSAIFGQDSAIDDVVALIQRIANIVVIFFIVYGVQDFAVQLKDEKMVRRGNRVGWIIAIPYIISAVASFIPALFGGTQAAMTISGILMLVGGIFGVIGSIMFLVYLGQAKKMLKN